MFFNDHKQSKQDHAACAVRVDSPTVQGQAFPGKWKLFFTPSLIRTGTSQPTELYNLSEDPVETKNLLGEKSLERLVTFLTHEAKQHRNAGGYRLNQAAQSTSRSVDFTFHRGDPTTVAKQVAGHRTAEVTLQNPRAPTSDLTVICTAYGANGNTSCELTCTPAGLGVSTGASPACDASEAIVFRFSHSVVVESVTLVAGSGQCGGFYTIGDKAPSQVYCMDADNDEQDQSGNVSDLGVVLGGEVLRFDSSPFLGVEPQGEWSIAKIVVRVLNTE